METPKRKHQGIADTATELTNGTDTGSASGLDAGQQTIPGSSQEKIVLGKIASPFGVRGWSKITSYTEPPEGLLDYSVLEVSKSGKKYRLTLEQGKPHGKFLAVKFAGIDDRDQAALYTNALIEVSRDDLPDTQDGSYYWADLIGMAVQTPDGIDLGTVERMMETGANDVLVVCGDRERLIPWIQGDVVKKVELQQNLLTVEWDPDF